MADTAKMAPNMVVAHGGSGNGSNLRLRSLIGRNLTDEIYVIGGCAAPGGCPNADSAGGLAATCDLSGGANRLDQATTTPLGRTFSLQFRYRL